MKKSNDLGNDSPVESFRATKSKLALDLNLDHLLTHLYERKEVLKRDYLKILPWLAPCNVRVLLVTDGGLDFGRGDFGLSTFINCLQNDDRFYVRFDISIAHLRTGVSGDAMASSVSGITNRITDFRFDEPTHFNPGSYDQIWLFGIESNFHSPAYAFRNGHPTQYPADRLSNAELNVLDNFMSAKGGIFATGDHAALGRGLCGSIKRVKSMRLWNSTSSNNDLDEVSMNGPRRNDTNQIGHDAGAQFSDQSDDVPQTIEPKFYRQRIGRHINALYPHPLLCSKLGLIDVLPDHPHEGECKVPSGSELSEYPNAPDGSAVIPELIARGRVIAGNTATINGGTKSPTEPQSFGSISAYDGHRANVGRIVTDATWHHFVNVNLIGLVEGGIFDDLSPSDSDTKHDGFLSTLAGRNHLAKIKEYYLNIGVWISPPALLNCFNNKFLRKLLYSDRVMEASLADPHVSISKIPPDLFYSIGTHGKDVLGRSTSKCQSLQFIIDIIKVHIPEFIPRINPWEPIPGPDPGPESVLPWFDLEPVLNIMLGSVLVHLRQQFPFPSDFSDEKMNKQWESIVDIGATHGLQAGLSHYAKEFKEFEGLLEKSLKVIGGKLR